MRYSKSNGLCSGPLFRIFFPSWRHRLVNIWVTLTFSKMLSLYPNVSLTWCHIDLAGYKIFLHLLCCPWPTLLLHSNSTANVFSWNDKMCSVFSFFHVLQIMPTYLDLGLQDAALLRRQLSCITFLLCRNVENIKSNKANMTSLLRFLSKQEK